MASTVRQPGSSATTCLPGGPQNQQGWDCPWVQQHGIPRVQDSIVVANVECPDGQWLTDPESVTWLHSLGQHGDAPPATASYPPPPFSPL